MEKIWPFMFPLAVLGSQGIVVKCTAAIFFRTVDCSLKWSWIFAESQSGRGKYLPLFTDTEVNTFVLEKTVDSQHHFFRTMRKTSRAKSINSA